MFSVIPIIYLGALAAAALAYLLLLLVIRKRNGLWLHYKYAFRFWSFVGLFSVLYWGAIAFFTGVEREHVFLARYESFAVSGSGRKAYRFRYVDYPESSETVYSEELSRYLEEAAPEHVRLILITTWDFGYLRAYHLQKVDHIDVNAGWSNGQPPWDVLRQGM
jgi:hypothetical protein